MLKQMEHKIKGRCNNENLITRNYESLNSSKQKAKSENWISNKPNITKKLPSKNFYKPVRSSAKALIQIDHHSTPLNPSTNTSASIGGKKKTGEKAEKKTFDYWMNKKSVKWKKLQPNQSLNGHFHKMTKKSSGKKRQREVNETIQVQDKHVLDMESEREAFVIKKRGQKKKELKITKGSNEMSQGKQSLLEAKEPSPEIITKASYLKMNDLGNDHAPTSKREQAAYQIPEIMNIYTVDSNTCFGKHKYSNKRSTFLDEEEEADMWNVNEFVNPSEMPSKIHQNPYILPQNQRVLKSLPITKESFLHWHRQSMLKSFATSQSASFISPTPQILRQPQAEASPSTVFLEESSGFFEEFPPISTSRAASRYELSEAKRRLREERLHNCGRVVEYRSKGRESVAVSRNRGDEGVEYGETREVIEVVFEVEEEIESGIEDTPQPK
jgi:hypothetical protein